MKRIYFAVPVVAVGCAGVLAACSGDDVTTEPVPDAGKSDVTAQDTSLPDTNAPLDANEAGADTACPSAWTDTPDADPSLEPEAGPLGAVVLHAQVPDGGGYQDYMCEAADDAGIVYKWTLVGPEADLHDCHGAKIGQHFPSDGGATRPEWFTMADTSFVIGKKIGTFTPDGGSGSVPWLLLQEVSNGGSGPISTTQYVQRLYTNGGNPPSTGCALITDADGGILKVPYTADYYFFGP